MSFSLYYHIPFCAKKCPYCHFFVLPNKKAFHESLLFSLKKEWALRKELCKNKRLETLYFGGGTPYLFGTENFSKLLEDLPLDHCSEISLELNPEQLDLESLRTYRSMGINRVSIGVQSFSPRLLKKIGRGHSAQQAVEAVFLAQKAGFSDISIDLIYELPTQSLEEWRASVEEAIKLPISHLSLYNLQIEKPSLYYKQREQIQKEMPEEDLSLAMHNYAIESFAKAGFERYEISAFARSKAYSKHNLGYWQGRPFLGLGPSAFSYWDGARFSNFSHFGKYQRKLENNELPLDFFEKLEGEKSERERLAIALRVLEGVNFSETKYPAVLEDLKNLSKQGLLLHDKDSFSLSEKGLLFYDRLASELI